MVAGYKLKVEGEHIEIDLCPKGTVSFYDGDPSNQDKGIRVPYNNDAACIACGNLDDELALVEPKWAHTFAPRKGMTQCVPCPGGAIPNTVGTGASAVTASCKACPNGTYRDAYYVSATCMECGPGKEVGPTSKMDCTQW